MSKDLSLEEIKKFWPQGAPDIKNVPKYISKYKKEKIVIKCGGNILIDPKLFNNFIEDIVTLKKLGLATIIVHGGGPRIKKSLEKVVGFEGDISWHEEHVDHRPKRTLDVSRAEREFGFKAKTTLEEGLKKTIDWYSRNYVQPQVLNSSLAQ